MKTSIPTGRNPSERLLLVVFALLVGSLLVATITAQRMSTHVAELSDSLTENTMPRIESIASLRDATLEIQVSLAELVHLEDDPRERAILDARLSKLEREVQGDLASSTLPAELSTAWQEFHRVVEYTRSVVEHDPGAARTVFQQQLLPAANRLGDRAMHQIERSARTGRELAVQLQATRGRVIWLSYALIAVSSIVAAGGIMLLRRQSAKRLAVVDEYARDQESKANEMEQFAGRVAHDIRSPLATASLATEMLDEEIRSDEGKAVLARLQRSLARTSTIIDGLLEFARAGAHPEPGARASLDEVIRDIADGIAPELERSGIELELGRIPRLLVGCSPGVLASLIGNLVRNAMKYMDPKGRRWISISASEQGGSVRVEVRDSGPGIPQELVHRLFEPYFRVTTNTQPGIGLGLPTVRKLAERHGGTVGVSSVVGKGSTFWFELPYAGNAWEPSALQQPVST